MAGDVTAEDVMNAKIGRIERDLVATGFTAPAEVCVVADTRFADYVAFTKFNGVWRLVWASVEIPASVGSVTRDETPLVNVSRQRRIAAVRALPKLVEELRLALVASQQDVRQACIDLDALHVALTTAPKET